MRRRIILTGGSGFAGRHMAGRLLEEGWDVFALEHRTPLLQHPGMQVIRGGLEALDAGLIRSVAPECIFHLARPVIPRWRKAGRIMAAWQAARLNRGLVRAIRGADLPVKLVFASGSLMYGSSALPAGEDAPLRPESYARQYYRGELPILEAIAREQNPVTVLRFPWLLGKGSWFEWFYLNPVRQFRMVPLFGEGLNLMEVIDVEDAARMAVKLISGPAINSVVNVLSAGPVRQVDFAHTTAELAGVPVKDYRLAFPKGIEKEALQAFTSNIVLSSARDDAEFRRSYRPLKDTLAKIFEGF